VLGELMAGISDLRTIANVSTAQFEPMQIKGAVCDDVWWFNISFDEVSGRGSYLMIMAPGSFSAPHRHLGMEEFYVLDGEMVDFDGTIYGTGDFVSLKAGSQHQSTSPSGCKLIVTHHGKIRNLQPEEWDQAIDH